MDLLFYVTLLSLLAAQLSKAVDTTGVNRCSFPKGFVFGTASAAYQYEGAVKQDGRKPSIWDKFSHTRGKILDGSNGDVAEDQYNRYKEDIALMKNMGMDAYRFSISWPRIFPDGDPTQLNLKGVEHYNKLINALLDNGIQPYVTLYHWDLPQALEDSIGGWLSSDIPHYFSAFADACFNAFGDRVKHWITFNEPHSIALAGYDLGIHAPGRCTLCSKGHSATEPYIVGHNILRSHAAVVQLYRSKYQTQQGGSIGISLDSFWYEPLSNSTWNREAAERALAFELGWFLDPLTFGDYPPVMRKYVEERLPRFTEEEKSSLIRSFDFLGLNHYTSNYAAWLPGPIFKNLTGYYQDSRVLRIAIRNFVPIGPRAASIWLYIVPWGFNKLVNYIKEHYSNPIIIITENGVDQSNRLSKADALKDNQRISYYNDYLTSLHEAIRGGADVRGYFAWSLLDNWEWNFGFTSRFGLYYVDYNDNLRRQPKSSVTWFQGFLNHTCGDTTN